MHGRRLRLRVGLCGLAVASALFGAPPAGATGTCSGVPGFHYAGQITSHTSGYQDCLVSEDAYYGWDGVNGQLTSPTSLATMGDWTVDHVIGWLNMGFASSGGQVQTGWYIGTLNEGSSGGCNIVHVCIQSQSSYRLYTEYTDGSGNMQVDSHGLWGTAASRTERVVYTGGGCYDVWTTYTFDQGSLCYSYPSSGSASAFAEVKSTSAADSLPDPKFGTTSSTANEALRLHGSSGFVLWDTNIAQSTFATDTNGYTPCYAISYTEVWWYFATADC